MAKVVELASEAIQAVIDAYNTDAKTLITPIANVKGYGAKGDYDEGTDTGTDDTTAFQDAVNSGYGIIFVPDGNYLIDPTKLTETGAKWGISIPSNITIWLSRNTKLYAKTNAEDNYAIFGIFGVSNVDIIGGTFIGDRNRHTGTTGEWGHCIDVRGSSNVTIQNVIAKDAWGDGIFVGKRLTDNSFCSKVTLINVTVDNNRRQGCSVIGCDDFKAIISNFINTNGTSPEAGIDFETNGTDTQSDAKIIGCTFKNNNGGGIDVIRTTNVRAIGCYFEGNNHGVSAVGDENNSLTAEIIATNCEFKDNTQASARVVRNYGKIKLYDCTMQGTPSVGHIYCMDTNGTNKLIRIRNVKVDIDDNTAVFKWQNTDTDTKVDINGLDVFINGPAATTFMYGNVIFKNVTTKLGSAFVDTNITASKVWNFVNSATAENCKFVNNTTTAVIIDVDYAINCEFDQYFTGYFGGATQHGRFLTVHGNFVAATTPGSVTYKIPVYDESGTILGYLPVYDTIS